MKCAKHLNACGCSLLLMSNCECGLYHFCFWETTCAKLLTQSILEEIGDYLCRSLIFFFKAIKFVIETARKFLLRIVLLFLFSCAGSSLLHMAFCGCSELSFSSLQCAGFLQ